MRYLNIEPSFLVENPSDILKINKKDFYEGKEFPLFKRKDIALVIGSDFESLSDDHKEVENGAKRFTNDFSKIFIADTDLNALKFIQERKVHLSSDYLPILRAFEIDEMLVIYKENNPSDFLDDDHRKKDKVLRAILLIVNFETRERKVIDIIYSETKENLIKLTKDFEKEGFSLLYMFSPEDLYFYEEEINKTMKNSGRLDFKNIAYNERNNYDLNVENIYNSLTERELGDLFNPLSIYKQDLLAIKNRREERGDNYYYTLINFLRNKLITEVNDYSEIMQYALFEDNIANIDYLTAGRLSINTLISLKDFTEKRENAILDLINNAKELLDEIDNLLEK